MGIAVDLCAGLDAAEHHLSPLMLSSPQQILFLLVCEHPRKTIAESISALQGPRHCNGACDGDSSGGWRSSTHHALSIALARYREAAKHGLVGLSNTQAHICLSLRRALSQRAAFCCE